MILYHNRSKIKMKLKNFSKKHATISRLVYFINIKDYYDT